MRMPLVLAIAILACATTTIGFIRYSDYSSDPARHAEHIERKFKVARDENRKDDASREKLAWLSCETNRVDEARKIMSELHASHQPGTAWSSVFSGDFDKMAQVEICATKFDEALRFYQEKEQYDAKFLPAKSEQLKSDANDIAVMYSLIAQTKSNDSKVRDTTLEKADVALQRAGGADAPHDLFTKETALVIAQQKGTRGEIDRARKELDKSRTHLKMSVPISQF